MNKLIINEIETELLKFQHTIYCYTDFSGNIVRATVVIPETVDPQELFNLPVSLLYIVDNNGVIYDFDKLHGYISWIRIKSGRTVELNILFR